MRPLHNSSVVRTFDALFTQQSCVFRSLALNNRFAQSQNIGHFAIGTIILLVPCRRGESSGAPISDFLQTLIEFLRFYDDRNAFDA